MIRKINIMMCYCILTIILVGCGSKNVPTNNDAVAETTEEKSYDFRNSNWGDSIEDVKSVETLELLTEEEELLVYSGYDISGIDVSTIYYFDNEEKLYLAAYVSNESHTNENLYIEDYNKLKGLLSEKYGDTLFDDDMLWKNDLYKDTPEKYGMAVCTGELVYTSWWVKDNTNIMLTLRGDNYKSELILSYEDVNNKQETDLSGL